MLSVIVDSEISVFYKLDAKLTVPTQMCKI